MTFKSTLLVCMYCSTYCTFKGKTASCSFSSQYSGNVPRERGTPPRHVQLLHQLPGLLLRLQPVQGRPLKSRQDQKVLSDFLRGFSLISR